MKLSVAALTVLLLTAAAAVAQQPSDPPPIQDNSFLVEEAYNQEAGVVQHIFTFARSIGEPGWTFSFTQEWPAGSQKHQLSYTIPAMSVDTDSGFDAGLGDVAVNYRYQLAGNGDTAVACAPRFSLIIPTGSARLGVETGAVGLQGNVPLSIQHSRHLVTHWNAGITYFHDAELQGGIRVSTRTVNLGQSLIWLAAPRFNVLLESVWIGAVRLPDSGRPETVDTVLVNPGIRWAHNLPGGLQIVPGVSFPIGVGPSRGEHSVLFYLSFEHPFRSRER